MNFSPVGTVEKPFAEAGFSRPYGTGRTDVGAPSDESPGYFRMSLRDKLNRILTSGAKSFFIGLFALSALVWFTDASAARALARTFLATSPHPDALVTATSLFSEQQPVAPLKVTDVSGLAKRIQARFLELRKDAEFPGVNIGIVWGNDKAMSVAVGFSDLESQKALKPEDRMLAGSIGKTYVSAITLLLAEEGQLNLDDKIEKWLGREAWFSRLPNAKDITLRMLMNHSSGIPEHVVNKDFTKALLAQPDKVWKPEELVAYILDSKPLFEAGKGWSYADTNYILVGMIFERVSGKTVYGEVQRRILSKLKLKETLPSDSRVIPGLIPGYSQVGSPFGFEGRTIIDGKFIVNPQMEWCGGGFASTAQDLARWAKFLYEGKVIDRPSLDELLQAVPAKTGKGDKYGLGVQVRESQWGVSYGHGGWFPGYLSEMEYFPQHKAAIAVQFNTDDFRKLKRRPRAYVAQGAQMVFGTPSQAK